MNFPALPRATKRLLFAIFVAALLHTIILTGRLPIPEGIAESLSCIIAGGLGMALPLSVLVPRLAPRPPEPAWGWRAFRKLGLFSLGGFLSMLAMTILMAIPARPWERVAPPPEPIVELVTTAYGRGDHRGVLVTRAASGQLYSLRCRDACEWSAEEALPAPSNPDEYRWSGCGPSEMPGTFGLFPPLPGRPAAMLPTKSCGPHSSVSTYYMLTNDGALWLWQEGDSIYAAMGLVLFAYPMSFLVGGVVALLWVSERTLRRPPPRFVRPTGEADRTESEAARRFHG